MKTNRTKRRPVPAGLEAIIEAAGPMLEKYNEAKRQQEQERLQVFRDAFALAENSKQRVALACAYLGSK